MPLNDCRQEKWGKKNLLKLVGDLQFTSPKPGFHPKSAADNNVHEHLKNIIVFHHCLVGN